MPQGFIVIQIGNEQLDRLCTDAIVPALIACGLDPKRVDKHNEGGLLKSEIIRFINDSDIIVADLTNERPNVYLEVGYTMGVDKFKNLILTVRQDHFPDSPDYKRDGPRVHFDLAGYDILRWGPDKLPEFRAELEKRIRRRQIVVSAPARGPAAIWDAEWIAQQRGAANSGLAEIGRSGYMEVRAALAPPKILKTQGELNEATRGAQINTFGWPIAPYLNTEAFRPKARADGIVASVKPETKESYDYWAIRRIGDFYFAASLFEDERRPGFIFFNTRIVRVTEALLYLARLYTTLGVERTAGFSVAVRHGGLKGRRLQSSNTSRELSLALKSEEDVIEAEISTSTDEIEAKLVEKVKELLAPLFAVFEFFQLSDKVYEDIVNRFVKGEVS